MMTCCAILPEASVFTLPFCLLPVLEAAARAALSAVSGFSVAASAARAVVEWRVTRGGSGDAGDSASCPATALARRLRRLLLCHASLSRQLLHASPSAGSSPTAHARWQGDLSSNAVTQMKG